MPTKKVLSAGRFGAGYGSTVKARLVEIEKKQRKKQICPYCNRPSIRRISMGIWHCRKCGKKFASHAYVP